MNRALVSLRRELSKQAATCLEGALDGDAGAAMDLVRAVPSRLRGLAVRALLEARVPPDVLRPALRLAWDQDHASVLAAAGTPRRVVELFRHAAFPIPEHLPEQVTVWRGAVGMSKTIAARGVSWTVNRDVACWFACGHAPGFRGDGEPVVLRAEVPRSDIVYHSDADDEAEIILSRMPQQVTVDGTAAEWQKAGERHAAKRRRAEAAWPATPPPRGP